MIDGKDIKAKRKAFNWSAKKLAEVLNVNKDNIYKWEKGTKISDPEEYLRVQEWLKSGKLENVPHGTSNLSDSQPNYGQQAKTDDTYKIILNLSESSIRHADAALLREHNYKETMDRLKSIGGDPEQMPPASEARLNKVLEILAEIGSGQKKWKTFDEGVSELYRIFYGSQKKGTRDGSGKVSKGR